MKLIDLAYIKPMEGATGVVSFAPSNLYYTPNDSPVDIFSMRQGSKNTWLETVQDAKNAAAILRIGILIAHTINAVDPVAGLQTVPAMIGPAFFGGPAEFEKFQRQIDKIVLQCKTITP